AALAEAWHTGLPNAGLMPDFLLLRINLADDGAERKAAVARWGERIVGRSPAIHFISPEGQWRKERTYLDPDFAQLSAALYKVRSESWPDRICNSIWSNWLYVRKLLAQGPRQEAVSRLHRLLEDVKDAQTTYAFLDEARTAHAQIIAEGRAELV